VGLYRQDSRWLALTGVTTSLRRLFVRTGVNESNRDFSTVKANRGILLMMSKVKSSPEKKRISLVKDRRNVYGECPTSSRKNIRRGKQRGHMEVRRAANEELRALKGATVETDADEIESRAKDRILALARSSFKKHPDAPLGEVLMRKLKRRAKQATGRRSR
jgi:hypothetical protein